MLCIACFFVGLLIGTAATVAVASSLDALGRDHGESDESVEDFV